MAAPVPIVHDETISVVVESTPIVVPVVIAEKPISVVVYQGTPGLQGMSGAPGVDGEDGASGREVEILKGVTHLQWRYVGDTNWINLVALADLKGDPGQAGEQGAQGAPGPQGLPGTPGVDGEDGASGKEVELLKGETHLQWRYIGDADWINLVALADLKGLKGDPGEQGVQGVQGLQGQQGPQGPPGEGVGTIKPFIAAMAVALG